MIASPAEARRIARHFPSFRDFVDDALFHPQWGYYSTGQVRFGEGGHYDTFPVALAPMFGRMVAQCAFRFWDRNGRPADFELCELGAGNGQLALDVIVWVDQRAQRSAVWRAFAHALHYRIIDRSAGLIRRQRQQLGPLRRRVRWTRADLSRRAARGTPFARVGLVVANEVLDCLAHHKVVPLGDGTPGVVYVVPVLRGSRSDRARTFGPLPGLRPQDHAVPHAALAQVLADLQRQRRLRFKEVVLPVTVVPGLADFLWRHYPEFFQVRRFKPYFACPEIEPLIHNTARLYATSEMLWIDYGDTRDFHLRTRPERRVFAGPPFSGASVYRAPGGDDITFLVDFSVVADAARRAGLGVKFFGGQGELARRSGVRLDRAARRLILEYRMLGWMLSVVGVGPERAWRHTGLTWGNGRGGRVRDDVRKAVAEFCGERPTNFKLMILASPRRGASRGSRSRPMSG